MNNHECTIGILWDYENSRDVTYNDLRKYVEGKLEQYNTFKDHPVYKKICRTPKPLTDYCNRRKSLMRHFTFCPDCGKEIDWKDLRARCEEAEEKHGLD